MADKYIKLSDLKKKLNYIYRACGISKQMRKTVNVTIGRIPYVVKGELETALETYDTDSDAEPVRHGHIVKKKRVIGKVELHKCPECSHIWQKDKRCKIDEWLCSECGKVLAHNYTSFCPNCGAKMDEM